jgi:hypothetical protein
MCVAYGTGACFKSFGIIWKLDGTALRSSSKPWPYFIMPVL